MRSGFSRTVAQPSGPSVVAWRRSASRSSGRRRKLRLLRRRSQSRRRRGGSLLTALQPGDVVGLAGSGSVANRAEQLAGDLGVVSRSPMTSTLALFHLRAPVAVAASVHSAARTPGTLFAAIDAPVPVQQNSTPVSTRPWRPARRRRCPPRPTRWARHREGRRARRRGRAAPGRPGRRRSAPSSRPSPVPPPLPTRLRRRTPDKPP